LAGFRALYTKFIDHEVVIALPDKWISEDTKRSINELTREGHFEQYGSFDPNNACRIALNWTQKEVNGIFAKVVLEYQECMKRYTMGTGGGPGAPKNFLTWETRDESYVALYTQQASGSYLAVVHIWDKNYGFPLVSRRDPMPDHCMIDDTIDGANEDSSPPEVLQTPLPGAQSNQLQSRSLRKEKGVEYILEKMNAERHEVTNAVKEMVGIMRSAGDGSRSSSRLLGGEPHEIMEQINKSKALIATCEGELKELFRRKRAINKSNSSEMTQKQSKKIKMISKSIRAEKNLIVTLRSAMEDQRKRLASITKSTGETDEDDNSSRSEDDDDYDVNKSGGGGSDDKEDNDDDYSSSDND